MLDSLGELQEDTASSDSYLSGSQNTSNDSTSSSSASALDSDTSSTSDFSSGFMDLYGDDGEHSLSSFGSDIMTPDNDDEPPPPSGPCW